MRPVAGAFNWCKAGILVFDAAIRLGLALDCVPREQHRRGDVPDLALPSTPAPGPPRRTALFQTPRAWSSFRQRRQGEVARLPSEMCIPPSFMRASASSIVAYLRGLGPPNGAAA